MSSSIINQLLLQNKNNLKQKMSVFEIFSMNLGLVFDLWISFFEVISEIYICKKWKKTTPEPLIKYTVDQIF